MKYLHVRLCSGEHGSLEAIYVLYTFVFHQVCEPFLLHAGHIKDVAVVNVLFHVGCLDVLNPFRVKEILVLFRHFQLLRRGENEFRIEV